jgi:hypothetical protein
MSAANQCDCSEKDERGQHELSCGATDHGINRLGGRSDIGVPQDGGLQRGQQGNEIAQSSCPRTVSASGPEPQRAEHVRNIQQGQQSVESRSVSMRVGHPSPPQGSRCDGSMHASHRGLWVHRSVMDGVALCRMFNRATQGQSAPTYLSSDRDPVYRFHQWQANLRILDVKEIKTVPYVSTHQMSRTPRRLPILPVPACAPSGAWNGSSTAPFDTDLRYWGRADCRADATSTSRDERQEPSRVVMHAPVQHLVVDAGAQLWDEDRHRVPRSSGLARLRRRTVSIGVSTRGARCQRGVTGE